AQGVPASRILLTFTRRAASDMLARAAAGSGDSAERICGGTFHAIAHKIIRQHAESFSLPPQFTILDPGDVADILDVLRPDHGLADSGQSFRWARGKPDGKQLTCVGDDAQAIYGFRGADPAHLRQLVADYPGLDIVRLDRNYRSRQPILDLANLVRPSAPGLDLTL